MILYHGSTWLLIYNDSFITTFPIDLYFTQFRDLNYTTVNLDHGFI